MGTTKATDYKCIECGKQAEVFWPIIDPDIESHPYCKPCVKDEQLKIMILFNNLDEENKENTE